MTAHKHVIHMMFWNRFLTQNDQFLPLFDSFHLLLTNFCQIVSFLLVSLLRHRQILVKASRGGRTDLFGPRFPMYYFSMYFLFFYTGIRFSLRPDKIYYFLTPKVQKCSYSCFDSSDSMHEKY